MKNTKPVVYAVLTIGAIIFILPFIWMILTAFKTYGESISVPVKILPNQLNFNSYKDALNALPYTGLYINTLLLMAGRVICAVVFSSMAGYAFAKLDFPFKNALFFLIVIQLMLPSQIFIIPQYLMVSKIGQLNTVFALIFPGIVSAFGTFFLRQTYMSMPDELSEAATLDGCNKWQVFYKVLMPLTKTAVMALAIFTSVFAWSDLMWPLIVNTTADKMTLAAGLSSLKGQFMTKYPLLMAGSLLSMWPMLLLYMLLQKQFVEGISMTGTKG